MIQTLFALAPRAEVWQVKVMRNLVLPLVLAACVAPAFAAEGWLTDLDEAKKVAAQENKDILIEFTGSDWCPPCMKMRADVMTKDEFIKPTSEKFVLVELDYPKSKEQAQEVKIKNNQLAKQYGVEAFPTVVFADAQARPFGVFLGGRDMQGVNDEIKVALEAKESVLNALAATETATTDEDKVETIAKLLETVPEEFADTFYKPQQDLLTSLDKEDKYGFRAKEELKNKTIEQEKALLHFMRTNVKPDTTSDEALTSVVKYIDETPDLLPITKQKASFLVIQMLLQKGEVDQAIAKMDEALALDPNSDVAQNLKKMRLIVESNKDKIKAAAQQKSAPAPAPAPQQSL